MKRIIAVDTWQRVRNWALSLTLLALTVPAAQAADAGANKLQSIDVKPLAGKQMQLTLHMQNPAPEPLTFTIDKPARISLDLADSSLALPSRRVDVRSNGLDSVLAAEANGRVRVVLNLDSLQPYHTTVNGNDIVVTLGVAGASAGTPQPAQGTVAAAATPAAAAATGRAIRSIDFRRGDNGAGRLIVRLSDPRTPINLRQQGSQLLVDFTGADLPRNLTRRYDTMDFATPVTGFDATRVNGDTRLVINTNGEFEQLAYQSDDQYVVEVQPVRRTAQEAITAEKKYTGEKIRLSFQDIDLRAVLQVLADTSGKNIVVSDSVNGSVTLRLQDVPWDQALDIVMRTKGLDKREQGNVILVAPADELAAREKSQLAAQKDLQELSPLRTEFLQINYAKAADIAALLKGGSSGGASSGSGTGGAPSGGGGNGNTMMSPRGSIAVDERTNTLLLSDTAEKLAEIRRLVATLDVAIQQVLIESRIVIVNDDFSRDLGVRAGLTNVQSNGNNGLFMTTGTAAGADNGLSSAINNLQSNGTVYPVGVSTGANASNRYNVNLPVANPAGSLAFMLLGSDYVVDLELSAAQAEGRGEIVSAPRIVTQNQKEAVIRAGTEIPYQQAAGGSSGGTTIQFKDAVLSLKVTPLITPDGNIILDLNVSKDSVGTVIVTSGGVNVPSIDTRSLTATVMVGDGQTVVLGGILETTQRDTNKKVPYLGDIPVLGHLFKTTSKTNDKNELLIFVTPKVLRDGVSVN
jgi:type IV pilus assembly protein PilQ